MDLLHQDLCVCVWLRVDNHRSKRGRLHTRLGPFVFVDGSVKEKKKKIEASGARKLAISREQEKEKMRKEEDGGKKKRHRAIDSPCARQVPSHLDTRLPPLPLSPCISTPPTPAADWCTIHGRHISPFSVLRSRATIHANEAEQMAFLPPPIAGRPGARAAELRRQIPPSRKPWRQLPRANVRTAVGVFPQQQHKLFCVIRRPRVMQSFLMFPQRDR